MGTCNPTLQSCIRLALDLTFENVDAWLKLRSEQLKQDNINLEHARTAMMKARKAAASTVTYAVGDQIKVSQRVLPLRVPSTQSVKLQTLFWAYRVVEVVNPGAYRLEMSKHYDAVPDVFNENDLRPWFDTGTDREIHDPPVEAHPALICVVQVLDLKS